MEKAEMRILKYVNSELSRNSNLQGESNLLEFIDSLDIERLIVFIEGEFDIKIFPSETTLDNFQSVDSITVLVERKLLDIFQKDN